MKKINLIIILSALLLTGCKQQELLQGLDQVQANEVIALLQRNNIHASKQKQAKEGFSISVAPEDFAASVDLMNSHGLPRKPEMQIAQMFPADSLVSSPRAEKARLYSAIEQRLGQSLLAVNGVATAKVHISYDADGGDGKPTSHKTHLSALLSYDSRVKNKELLIGDVKKFLKNSFSNVEYENISVVLTPMDSVQRAGPVALKKSAPSYELILSVFSGIACLLLLVFLCLRKSHPQLADRLKNYSKSKKSSNADEILPHHSPEKAVNGE
ncbi:type III secretion system inner membrane ring lipoprotein SctJ [Kalamiella sp. sgz302252]|uniref:type III secretion system inner membrane ring lipoprotein SctJ n=1 Tax=Pantoea sp. sgz302252 TaxID=3341827 RepID=UPI0036D28A86